MESTIISETIKTGRDNLKNEEESKENKKG